ncbi:triacylglycerol acidic lipase TAL3 [Tripterygium wilfordii]|uniref:Triacylglycerol acidic lipase TAL3 n=1 Tax=Tripterygium wilfordii TaxID=458696 RepID=A0A7J7E2V6_TRIWF|nr:triacylglycerol acidic lipase TAL3 [Tripterygium wilfordii]
MECDKGLSKRYMNLKPEEVRFVDLFRILFSVNIDNKNFVDSKARKTKEDTFDIRWLIFLSIVAQKLLQFVSKPLSFIGSTLELLLNLLSFNTNIIVLLFNVLRGKVVVPDRESANFKSFVGKTDERTELDANIGRGDGMRYFAALSSMASKVSYENKAYIKAVVEDQWKMELLGSYDFRNDFQDKATTQAFICRDKTKDQDTIVVAFRGTEPFDADAWCTDIDLSWYKFQGAGKIHGGFMKALGMQKCAGWSKEVKKDVNGGGPLAYYTIRDMLREILTENDRTKFIVTGHSLGGALAILFPAVLAFHEEKLLLERLEGVYTFGQPRVGDGKFGNYMEKTFRENGINYYRFVYCNDMVPRVPYDYKGLLFKHFGTCVYHDRRYKGKVSTIVKTISHIGLI